MKMIVNKNSENDLPLWSFAFNPPHPESRCKLLRDKNKLNKTKGFDIRVIFQFLRHFY